MQEKRRILAPQEWATPESPNDYAMARYHVNRLGRFSSPDLLFGTTGDPESLNRYPYVGNDPVNLVDPTGQWLPGDPDPWFPPEGPGGVISNGPEFLLRWDCLPFWWRWNEEEGIHDVHYDCGPWGSGPVDTWEIGGGGGARRKIQKIVNDALKQEKLAKCLNKFFGSGTILTNGNLPYVDATMDSTKLQAMEGRTSPVLGTPKNPVPSSGRATVYVASDVVNNPLAPELAQRVYLHETANVLAEQLFTSYPDVIDRAYLGPLGGPPTSEQMRQMGAVQQGRPGDPDIGREFERCVFGDAIGGVH